MFSSKSATLSQKVLLADRDCLSAIYNVTEILATKHKFAARLDQPLEYFQRKLQKLLSATVLVISSEEKKYIKEKLLWMLKYYEYDPALSRAKVILDQLFSGVSVVDDDVTEDKVFNPFVNNISAKDKTTDSVQPIDQELSGKAWSALIEQVKENIFPDIHINRLSYSDPENCKHEDLQSGFINAACELALNFMHYAVNKPLLRAFRGNAQEIITAMQREFLVDHITNKYAKKIIEKNADEVIAYGNLKTIITNTLVLVKRMHQPEEPYNAFKAVFSHKEKQKAPLIELLSDRFFEETSFSGWHINKPILMLMYTPATVEAMKGDIPQRIISLIPELERMTQSWLASPQQSVAKKDQPIATSTVAVQKLLPPVMLNSSDPDEQKYPSLDSSAASTLTTLVHSTPGTVFLKPAESYKVLYTTEQTTDDRSVSSSPRLTQSGEKN